MVVSYVFNPGYITRLTDNSLGRILVFAAFVFEIAGFLVMKENGADQGMISPGVLTDIWVFCLASGTTFLPDHMVGGPASAAGGTKTDGHS